MLRKAIHLIEIVLLLTLLASYGWAQVPRTISYQGRLTNDTGAPLDGTYSITFSLYDVATGGTALWSEMKSISVSQGLFTTALGSGTAFGEAVGFDTQYFLGVKVGTGSEMTPRQALQSVPYALGLPGITVSPAGPITVDVAGTEYRFRPASLDLAMVPGSTHYPYISWYDGDGSRGAYLGWGTKNSSLGLTMKDGVTFDIAGSMDINASGTRYLFHPGWMTLASAPGSTHYPFIDWLDTDGNRDAYLGYGTMNSVLELEMKSGLRFQINGPVSVLGGGNLGIGTTQLTDKLVVDLGAGLPDGGITIKGTSTTAGDIGLKIANTGTGGRNWYIDSTNNSSGYGGGKLAFVQGIGNAPLMTLADNGCVGIGTAYPGRTLDVNGDVYFHSNVLAGSVSCGVLTLTSSRRFKDDVEPIANPLDTISKLQGVSYNWDEEHGGKRDMGFIAEDVAKVLPELVTMEADGENAVGMDYAHLIALTIEGIKAQQKEIEALKAENAALAGEIEKLRTSR